MPEPRNRHGGWRPATSSCVSRLGPTRSTSARKHAGRTRRVAGSRRRPGQRRPAARARQRRGHCVNGPTALRHSRIIGLGEQPTGPASMTNDELPAALDTNDEWIRQRTGIARRGIAGDDETVVTMATDAARKAVADAGVDPAPHRAGRPGDLLDAAAGPRRRRAGRDRASAPSGAARSTSTPRAPASATRLVDRLGRDPARHRRLRRRHRRREDLRTGSTGPIGPPRSCSATAPARS